MVDVTLTRLSTPVGFEAGLSRAAPRAYHALGERP